MSRRATEGMVTRCGLRMIHAQTVVGDFGLAWHWMLRRDYYIHLRQRAKR